MERITIQPGYSVSRVIKGGWHLAGGHGTISEEQALEDMLEDYNDDVEEAVKNALKFSPN